MPLTPQQLTQAIKLTGTASLVTGVATVSDISNYGAIGVSTPNTVKGLLQIYDSTMQLVYQNAGYAAGDFTSPDLEPLLGTTVFTFSLPQNPDGTYKTGQYTVNYKVQCITDETLQVEVVKYLEYCNCCNGIKFNVTPNVSYNTALVTITDNTQYKGYLSLSRTMTLYPPLNVEAAQSTSAQTLVWVPTVPIGNPAPYTGMWQWTIESTIVYIDQVTGAQTTCKITGRGSFDVEQNQLCKVLCLLKKYRTDFYNTAGTKNAVPFELNYLLANAEFTQAIQAERCGRPQTEISAYIAKIYKLTGIDPDCECGCQDGNSQPLVPTSSINGTNGTDGSTILSGSGAPSGSAGNVGDYYIDTDTQDFYKKTGANTWTYLFNIGGAPGESFLQGVGAPSNGDGNDGDTYLDSSTGNIYLKVSGSWGSPTLNIIGAAGTPGSEILNNDPTNSSTTGTGSSELLKSYTLPANTLAADGDCIEVYTIYTTATPVGTSAQTIQLDFAGSNLVPSALFGLFFYPSNIYKITIKSLITRTSATSVRFDTKVDFYSRSSLLLFTVNYLWTSAFTPQLGDINALDLVNNTYDVECFGKSSTLGTDDVICEQLLVKLALT